MEVSHKLTLCNVFRVTLFVFCHPHCNIISYTECPAVVFQRNREITERHSIVCIESYFLLKKLESVCVCLDPVHCLNRKNANFIYKVYRECQKQFLTFF